MGIKHTPLTYRLQQYIPSPLIRSITQQPTTLQDSYVSEKLQAAVLFADVPGFTPLTETLSLSGLEGTEELTRLINGYFNKIIPILEEGGGEVVKFSGDALTALFIPTQNECLGHALQRAVETAQTMQDAMSLFDKLDISIGQISLGLKVSIGVGEVTAMQIGGIGGRWEYVIAGDPLQQISEIATQAVKGSILLSDEAKLLQQQALKQVTTSIPLSIAIPSNLQQFQVKLMGFIPRPLRSYLHQNMEEWIAELRTMSIVFISLKGLQVGHKQVATQLHPILQTIQELTYHYEGTVDKVTVDDKQVSILLLFGTPPFAYKNSPLRAIRCALDLQTHFQEQSPVKGIQLSIGITSGQAFAGPIGSLYRKTYTVMGDTVNIAARLMSIGKEGSIICDEMTYQQSNQHISYQILPPVLLRGKAEKINIFQPEGASVKNAQQIQKKTITQLIGRDKELKHCQQLLQELVKQEGKILLIKGEAGIGKSVFLDTCIHQSFLNGYQTLTSVGQVIEKNTPYFIWRTLLIQLFEIEDTQNIVEWRTHIQQKVEQLIPQQINRLPLLNDLLPINFPENKLTQSLQATLRHENLFIFFNNLFQALARNKPLVLVIDNAQWMDKASCKMLLDIGRAIAYNPSAMLLIIATRPDEIEKKCQETLQNLNQLNCTHKFLLQELSNHAITQLIGNYLQIPTQQIPPSLSKLIQKQAQGNPFYASELIHMLQEKKHIQITTQGDSKNCHVKTAISHISTELPSTIQGLIKERIDRLAPFSKHVLKVGAVIGNSFSLDTINAIIQHNVRMSKEALEMALADLTLQGLLVQENQETGVMYVFKHNFTQETAYQSLLFAHRRAIHETIAEWHITSYSNQLPNFSESYEEIPITLRPFLSLITHHFHYAGNQLAECNFAKLAGIQAMKQHDNQQALQYFLRANEISELVELKAQYEINQYLEKIYHLLGQRNQQLKYISKLHQLCEQLEQTDQKVALLLREATYYQENDNYPKALSLAQQTVQFAEKHQLPIWEVKGRHLVGELLILSGKYEAAKKMLVKATEVIGHGEDYERERFHIFIALGRILHEKGEANQASWYFEKAYNTVQKINDKHLTAKVANSIGSIALNQGELHKAHTFLERALNIHQEIGDRRGQGMLMNNIAILYQSQGFYEKAKEYSYQALKLNYAINSKKGQCIAYLGLGITYEKEAQYQQAINYLTEGLTLVKQLKIDSLEAYLSVNLGYAWLGLHQPKKARKHIQKSFKLRSKLGTRHWTLESLGALAHIDLYEQQTERALVKILELIQYLEETDGMMTIRNMWTCYQVLLATDHPKAQEILEKAYFEIIRVTETGINVQAKKQIKEKIVVNRQIIEEYQRLQTEAIDFIAFKTQLLEKLKDELPDKLYYHGFHHTVDVYKATCRLARQEGITGTSLTILKTAALLHDSGFIYTRIEHEQAGCKIAKSMLPQYGYTPDQIAQVCQLILATRIEQTPQSLSEKIICDADVDYLGRDDFYEIGATLRDELMVYEDMLNEKEWQQRQIQFLEQHQYYTQSARQLREAQKQEYLHHIKRVVTFRKTS